jgi:DnaJ-class molecular chaperone
MYDSQILSCWHCGGTGKIHQTELPESLCPICNGDGVILPELSPCSNCNGTGYTAVSELAYIKCHVCKGSGMDFYH